jgi:chemotaxis family two-component system sensor kinase Cph1
MMGDKPTYEEFEHKSDSNLIKERPIRLRLIVIAFGVFWTAVIAYSTVWDILATKRTTREIATKEAQTLVNKDQALRHWATAHGGVYVPINKRTPSNPYLSHISERDITTPSSKSLTLMNPAYMIRQLNEEYTDLYGPVGHLTSLIPIRPENAPDAWERSALEAFEKVRLK